MLTSDVAMDRMVPVAERLVVIDTLRAIALFGVIVMNLTAMVMIFKAPQVMATAGPPDLATGLFDLVFLQGKAGGDTSVSGPRSGSGAALPTAGCNPFRSARRRSDQIPAALTPSTVSASGSPGSQATRPS